MPAWSHTNYWNPDVYQDYRNYVATKAPSLMGRTEDCADLSMYLLVEFASERGLCLTLSDGRNRYISKADQQITDVRSFGSKLTWSDKDGYYEAVKRRIGARALYEYNTVGKRTGPQPGDLMITRGHAAVVFAYYPPAVLHPKAGDMSIKLFPTDHPEIAATQLDTLEYIRSRELNGHAHIDYLNHRGTGGKVKAELIYFADVGDMMDLRFEFRLFSDGVTDNWVDWDGTGMHRRTVADWMGSCQLSPTGR